MDQEKIGQIIKSARVKKNFTQSDLANLLGVSSQAVSKWELGKSIPDISVLRVLCEKLSLNIDELLKGNESCSEIDCKKTLSKKTWLLVALMVICVLICLSLGIYHFYNHNDDFEFKKISASCENFKIIGSAAYNKNKTSIYISNIDYCGRKNDVIYKKITWILYEKYGNTHHIISSGTDEKTDITLDKYLSNLTINVDNYSAMCKHFSDSGLFLEINAYHIDGELTTFEIPLTLEENC